MMGEMVSAPLGRRALAFLIDQGLVVIVGVPALIGWIGMLPHLLSGVVSPGELIDASLASFVLIVVGSALAFIVLLVQLILHGRRGVTLGKRLLGIRSVNLATLERPGFWRMLLRALTLCAAGLVVPVLGAAVLLASPLWARNRLGRGWLDVVGGNWIVDIRAGLDPYDAKAVRLARKRLESPEPQAEAVVPSLATGDAEAEAFVPGPRSRSAIVGAPLAGDAVASAPAAPVDPAPPRIVAPPPAAVPEPVASRAAAILLGDDGLRYELSGPSLIGRSPSPAAGQPPMPRVSVADETLSMSKTHARLEPAPNGVWVIDLHSSNGSSVLNRPDTPVACEPAVPMLAAWGSTLCLGDREFVVHQPGTLGGATA